MTSMTDRNRKALNSLFFFSYFGLGAVLPLLSVYLESIGFTGVQIGSVFSTRSLLAVLVPPLWGIISDRTGKHKGMLAITFSATLIMALALPFARTFLLFILAYGFLNIFMTASTPLADSIALSTSIPFGQVRKWGAYGFAIAALIAGYLSRIISLEFIFAVLAFSCIAALGATHRIKVSIKNTSHDMMKDLPKLLKDKAFMVFLLYCFLVGNTLISHNTFYGLYFDSIGGNLAWIGLSFFLFAMSEAPFMGLTNRFLPRFGIYRILTFSTFVGMFRWYFYFLNDNPIMVLILFPLQGLFFGTFLTATAEYVKTTVAPSIRSTAVSIYAAIFIGIGGIYSNFIGGYIYDYVNVESVYAFFGISCSLGLLVLLLLRKIKPLESSHEPPATK